MADELKFRRAPRDAVKVAQREADTRVFRNSRTGVKPVEQTDPDPKAAKPAEEKGGRFSKTMKNIGDFFMDEMFLSAGRVPATMGTFIRRNIDGSERNSYGEAAEDVNAMYDEAGSELTPFLSVPISVGTGLVQGPVKALDKLADPALTLWQKVASEALPLSKLTGRSAALAGTTNAFQSYMQGNTDFESLVQDGMFGAAAGGIMQRIVGNNVLPYAASRQEAKGPANLIRDLSDTGASNKGINLYTMAEAAEANKLSTPGGDVSTMNPFLTQKVGNAPLYRNWDAMADILEKYSFEGVPLSKIGTPEGIAAEQRYEDAASAVYSAMTDMNKAADDTYKFVVEPPASRLEALKNANERKRTASETYDRITNMREDGMAPGTTPIGARELDAQTMLKDVQALLVGNRTDMANTSNATKKMYNFFNDQIRVVIEESEAADFKNKPATSRTTRDDLFGKVPLARLVDAYKQLGAELAPKMSASNGFNGEDVLVGRKIMSYMADVIDKEALGEFGLAKGTFASAMAEQEAFDMGRKAYTQRQSEITGMTPAAYAKHYGDSIENTLAALQETNPDAYKAYQLGQRAGFDDGVQSHGFLNEMRNLTGEDTNLGEAGSFYTTKQGGIAALQRIFGKEDAGILTSMMEEGQFTNDAMKRIEDLFKARGYTKQDSERLADLAAAEAHAVAQGPSVGRLVKKLTDRFVKPNDQQAADEALEMLTSGKSTSDLINSAVIKETGGGPVQIGARAGNVAPQISEVIDDAPDREEEPEPVTLEEMLRQLQEP